MIFFPLKISEHSSSWFSTKIKWLENISQLKVFALFSDWVTEKDYFLQLSHQLVRKIHDTSKELFSPDDINSAIYWLIDWLVISSFAVCVPCFRFTCTAVIGASSVFPTVNWLKKSSPRKSFKPWWSTFAIRITSTRPSFGSAAHRTTSWSTTRVSSTFCGPAQTYTNSAPSRACWLLKYPSNEVTVIFKEYIRIIFPLLRSFSITLLLSLFIILTIRVLFFHFFKIFSYGLSIFLSYFL